MRGDPTLFMRSDQVEAAWEVISSILEVWKTITPTAFLNYQAGSWGLEVADTLIAQDGRSWNHAYFFAMPGRDRGVPGNPDALLMIYETVDGEVNLKKILMSW